RCGEPPCWRWGCRSRRSARMTCCRCCTTRTRGGAACARRRCANAGWGRGTCGWGGWVPPRGGGSRRGGGGAWGGRGGRAAAVGGGGGLARGVWLRGLTHDPDGGVRFAARAAAAANRQVDLSDRLREMRDGDPSPTVRQWAPYFLRRR